MKALKKLLSVLLCLIMAAAIMPAASAEEDYPVVFVAGYTSSQMFVNRGTENEVKVWKQDVAEKVLDAVKSEIPGVLAGAGLALAGINSPLFKTLDPYVNDLIEYMRLNDDGTSKYDVELYPHAVEDTRLDKLKEMKYYPDHDSLINLGEKAGDENVYCCTLDWRLGQVDNAAVLNDYINALLEATGKSKVNLMGVSFGGQVVASYLAVYGGEKANNVVLHCPALDGSTIVSELLKGDVTVKWSDALDLYCSYDKVEQEYSVITELISLSFLDDFLMDFINCELLDFFLNYGSVWDLVPLNEYAALRDKLLSDGTHAEIIKKSDYYHFEIAAKRAETFEKLRNEGVDISIIAGYGCEPVVSCGTNSDGVIDLASASGAFCAAPGKTLPDGYTQKNCPEHCHISPAFTVDASTGYLPENTWFVEDMYHGLGVNEAKVNELIMTLVTTEEIKDVHSSTAYPQFLTSQNRCRGVYCAFENCAEGFFTPYSTKLTVKNVSKKDTVYINSVSCEGADIDFGYNICTELNPGESTVIDVSGTLPADMSLFKIRIDFTDQKEHIAVGRSRVQSFRFTDGELLQGVLNEGVNEQSPRVTDSPAEVSGRLTFKAFFANLFYRLYLAIVRIKAAF